MISQTVRTMAECNIRRSLSRKHLDLLTVFCVLMVNQVASKGTLIKYLGVEYRVDSVDSLLPNFEPVAYRNVLKSNSVTIQSGIRQVITGNVSFSYYLYPVFSDEFIKTVVFVWASEQETHSMRDCLYQEMKRLGQMSTKSMRQLAPIFTFCNRSADAAVAIMYDVAEIRMVNVFVTGKENYERSVAKPSIFDKSDDTFSVKSQIKVNLVNYIGSYVLTFVCNSIEFKRSKAGKLQQRFFAVVGNSTEVIVKPSLNSSANVTLDFDVLYLNASRIGLFNDSDVELMSLRELEVSCVKLDPYVLNNETNEITYIDTTGERSMTTKAIIINNKLRVRVNVSIPVVSDHSFGDYQCIIYCRLHKKSSNNRIYGCIQTKYFSLVSDCWRNENILYRQLISKVNQQHKEILEIQTITQNNTQAMIQFIKENMELIFYKLVEISLGLTLKGILIDISIHAKYRFLMSTIGVSVIITIIYVIYKSVRHELNIRRDAKLFIAMLSKAQEMENSNRTIKYDVFLSYSSKDRTWVQSTLLTFIESKGFKVCFDERDFPYGCSLPSTIEKSIFESRKAIAILSPDYIKSGWCIEYEYLLLLTKILNKEASSGSLLLIKYRNCQLREHMKSFRYLDYTKTHDNKQTFVMRMLSYMFPLLERDDSNKIPDRTQFFEDLLIWLGEPRCRPSRVTREKKTPKFRTNR